MLLVIPNVSEGRDHAVIGAIGDAYVAAGAVLLDTHADPDHHRAVHTLAVPDPARIPVVLAAGAAQAIASIDLGAERGLHPHVGALDVAPVVYDGDGERGMACAAALTAAEELGRLGLPVFLYGELGGGRTRAELRRGGRGELTRRIAAGEPAPDFGPPQMHPSAGAVLVAARPPLVAFNVELAAGATLAQARDIAAAIREGGEDGLPGVRAIGLELTRADGLHLVQVSTNIEDYRQVPAATVLDAVGRHAAAPVAGAELVGVPPAAALEGLPAGLPLRNRRTLEDALAAASL